LKLFELANVAVLRKLEPWVEKQRYCSLSSRRPE
jgi:hypothetical protein